MKTDVEEAIIQDKQLRVDIDAIIQRLRQGPRTSRERALSTTKLQEAAMWLGMDLKAINEENPGAQENPYPNSKLTIDEVAQRSYEAYAASTGWKSAVTGANLPSWADLMADPDRACVVNGWRAVAYANPAMTRIDPTAQGLKL